MGQALIHRQPGGAGDQPGLADQPAYGLGGSDRASVDSACPANLADSASVRSSSAAVARIVAAPTARATRIRPSRICWAGLGCRCMRMHQVEDPGGPTDPAGGDPDSAREEAGTLQIEVRATDLVVERDLGVDS